MHHRVPVHKQPVRLFDFSPSCRKCKFNINQEWKYMDRCTQFIKKVVPEVECVTLENNVPTVHEFMYSSDCRSNEELCGVMAKNFMYADGQVEDGNTNRQE
jgi:hypothetical protein